MQDVSTNLLLGCDEQCMVSSGGVVIHSALQQALDALQADAERAGFELRVASGFRSFERQLAIWNAKASGRRPLLDEQGRELDAAQLNELERVHAILRWSALPGASRHHWGTDIDVYDAAAVPADYALQLTPEEVAEDGVFGPFHAWLDNQLAAGAGYGFFRPYNEDRGGIAPERWHLSYAPLSARCEHAWHTGLLREKLMTADMLLKDQVLSCLDQLYTRYIEIPAAAYPSAYTALLEPEHAAID